jgi:hypothetical protein
MKLTTYLHFPTCFNGTVLNYLSTGRSLPLQKFLKLQIKSRSQFSRGLRHELSSLARTLGSWVRIPLKAWMSVCAFILCLCCPVCRWRPCDGLILRPRSLIVCVKKKDYETGEESRAQPRDVEPLMNEMNEFEKVKGHFLFDSRLSVQ